MWIHALLIVVVFMIGGGFIGAFVLNVFGFPAMLIVGRTPETVSLIRLNVGALLGVLIQTVIGVIYAALVVGYIRQILSIRSPGTFATLFFFILGIISSMAPFYVNLAWGSYLDQQFPNQMNAYRWYFNGTLIAAIFVLMSVMLLILFQGLHVSVFSWLPFVD